MDLKAGRKNDLTINLRHLMDFGDGKFDIRILNTNQVVHSMEELVPIAGLYVQVVFMRDKHRIIVQKQMVPLNHSDFVIERHPFSFPAIHKIPPKIIPHPIPFLTPNASPNITTPMITPVIGSNRLKMEAVEAPMMAMPLFRRILAARDVPMETPNISP